MRRREFIAILGALAAPPLVARAQQVGRPPVVGLVFAVTPVSGMAGPDPTEPPARAFIHALRDLGWVDGQTVVVERRSAEGEPANAPAILGELVVRRADVIVLSGAPWLLQAAQRATRTFRSSRCSRMTLQPLDKLPASAVREAISQD